MEELLRQAALALVIGGVFAWFGGQVVARVRGDYLAFGTLRAGTLTRLIVLFLADAVLRTAYIAAFEVEPAPLVLGLTIGAMGLALVAVAAFAHDRTIREHGKGAQPHHGPRGPYRHGRNPRIVGYLLAMLGYTLLWPTVAGLIQLAVLALVLDRWVRVREDHLTRVHGDIHRRYRKRTRRYL